MQVQSALHENHFTAVKCNFSPTKLSQFKAASEQQQQQPEWPLEASLDKISHDENMTLQSIKPTGPRPPSKTFIQSRAPGMSAIKGRERNEALQHSTQTGISSVGRKAAILGSVNHRAAVLPSPPSETPCPILQADQEKDEAQETQVGPKLVWSAKSLSGNDVAGIVQA